MKNKYYFTLATIPTSTKQQTGYEFVESIASTYQVEQNPAQFNCFSGQQYPFRSSIVPSGQSVVIGPKRSPFSPIQRLAVVLSAVQTPQREHVSVEFISHVNGNDDDDDEG